MIFGTQSIERVRGKDTTDEYGAKTLDFEAGDRPADVTITGVSVQPGGGSEILDGRDQITTLYTVWAPLTADVTDVDRIRYAGTVYAIDGPVERWEVGTALDHLVIKLKAEVDDGP